MKEIENYKFTKEDFDACEWHYKDYFIDVLNGDYDLDQAREDLFSLIGSEYDKRIKSFADKMNNMRDIDPEIQAALTPEFFKELLKESNK